MPAPTARIRTIPLGTEASALNTAGKRIGAITGQAVVSTGEGNEANFGTVDISQGAANSAVLMMLLDFTADGGNSVVEDFKLWLSQSGFNMAGTKLMFAPLSGADQGSPSLTQSYQANATSSSYSYQDLPTSEPGSGNLYPTDEGSSMALSTTSDDALMWAWYLAVASGETTGTYRGVEPGYEFRASFKYSYS